MKPYSSSSEKNNCVPVSSNCVIWQGPDIPCINLCKGDSVSDIVYKLADELCTIKAGTDLSDIDFSCILTLCENTPEPQLTIAAVLQVIIDGICCSVTGLTSITTELTDKTNDLYTEPTLTLPACLQYVSPETGLPVTTLVLSQYVLNLASAFCSLKGIVDGHTVQISDHEIRIQTLENAPCCYEPPLVTPDCTYGTVTSGVPTDMDEMLSSLDSVYCNLVSTLGTNGELSAAGAQQCEFLGSQNALSQPGTMSGLTNWNTTISNFAQSIQNLWITVCDMRAAMASLKDCCAPDCSSFLFNYYTTLDTARDVMTFYFDGYGTVVPAGFTNCPTLSTITITDSDGHIYSNTSFDLLDNLGNYVVTDLVGDFNFNPALPYTVTITACVVKDGVVCSKTVTQVLQPSPSTTTCPCYAWSVNVDNGDLTAATGNTNTSRNGVLFVDWTNCANGLFTSSYNANGNSYVGCSCKIPYAYYYAADIKTTAVYSTLSFEGVCAP